MTNKTNKTGKKGYVAISMVLILLVVTIGITSAMLISSAGSSKNSESLRLGEQALYHSDMCLEEGLWHLKNDPAYNGGEISFPDGICHIGVENNDGAYAFQVYFSSAEKYFRPVEAQAEIMDGTIEVTSWKEADLDVE